MAIKNTGRQLSLPVMITAKPLTLDKTSITIDKNKEIFQKTRQPFVVKNLEKIDIEIIKKLKKEFTK